MFKTRLILLLVLSVLVLGGGGGVSAGDAAAGKKLARQCGVCHGKNGVSRDPAAPHLAGMSKIYMKKQLLAYKTQKRKDPRMSLIAANLSDDAIDHLAEWYSRFTITAQPPKLRQE